jgi:hypothetical protein
MVGFLLPTVLALLSGVASYPLLLAGLALVALAGTAVIVRHSSSDLPAADIGAGGASAVLPRS